MSCKIDFAKVPAVPEFEFSTAEVEIAIVMEVEISLIAGKDLLRW